MFGITLICTRVLFPRGQNLTHFRKNEMIIMSYKFALENNYVFIEQWF